MKDFAKLLITYYKPIVGLLFAIVGFVVAIIKKKPISSIEADIYDFCYKSVLATEATGIKGSDNKKSFCINEVNKLLLKKYPTLDVDSYNFLISVTIEMFLIAPHRKESSYEKTTNEKK